MIRGIAFDLFDTLVDQNHGRLPSVAVDGRRVSPSAPDLHRHISQEMGVDLSFAEFVELHGEVDRELFRETLKLGFELPTPRRFEALGKRLGLEGDSGFAETLTRIHMDMLRRAMSVPAHHEAILASLAVEYGLAICSNFSHGETARAIMDEAGFMGHLSCVVISDEMGIRKPRAEIFKAVADGLELAPEEILHVGDSLSADVAGAKASGMHTVWLTRQVANPDAALDDYTGPPPDYALEDLLDLPVLIARLSV